MDLSRWPEHHVTFASPVDPGFTMQKPDPADLYWPPDDGFPRLPFRSWEILWCLAEGWNTRTIQAVVGPFSQGYVSKVRARYRALGITRTLQVLASIHSYWPPS